jgi:mercuric ion transport protein
MHMASLNVKSSLAAGGVSAVIGSVCCIGPLALLSLGIGGAWVGNLTVLEPIRPVFIGLTLLFIALAFRRLYLMPQVCAPGTECADPRTVKRQRLLFWPLAVALIGLLAVPWWVPLFY